MHKKILNVCCAVAAFCLSLSSISPMTAYANIATKDVVEADDCYNEVLAYCDDIFSQYQSMMLGDNNTYRARTLSILENSESELYADAWIESNGFDVYTITKGNIEEIEAETSINIQSLFGDNEIPENVTMYVPNISQISNNMGISTYSASTSVPAKWVYLGADTVPAFYCDGKWNDISVTNLSAKDMAYTACDILLGNIFTGYAYTIASVMTGTVLNSLPTVCHDRNQLRLHPMAVWTRKYCCIPIDDEYVAKAMAETAKITEKYEFTYFNTSSNNISTKDYIREKTAKTVNYDKSAQLLVFANQYKNEDRFYIEQTGNIWFNWGARTIHIFYEPSLFQP